MPKPTITTRFSTLVFTLTGATLLVWLTVRADLAGIRAALSFVGLNLFWIFAYRFLPIGLDARGWRRLFPEGAAPRFFDLAVFRWIAESINTLLPAAQVGGHFIRARLLKSKKAGGSLAAASVMVDFTMGLTSQVLFVLLGLILFLRQSRGQNLTAILIGAVIALIALGGLYFGQRRGLFGLVARSIQALPGGKRFAYLEDGARSLNEKITTIYGCRKGLAACLAWRLAGWFARAGENWLFFYFAGLPITIQDAVVLESVSTGFRSAAFFIPGGLGVQDGALLVIGALIGMNPEYLMALALTKRFREIVTGVPGLILWGGIERRSASKVLTR